MGKDGEAASSDLLVPGISEPKLFEKRKALVHVFVGNTNLYAHSFIKCIDALGSVKVQTLIGPDYARYKDEIARIKRYRNKIMHGQITGQNLQSPQLEKDVRLLRGWIEMLAAGAERNFGYDGIARNTFIKAKSTIAISKIKYPFATVQEFKQWLNENTG